MEPLEILRDVTSRLDRLKIPYMVGGSFAGSFYGFARNTQDADLVVAMQPDSVDEFVRAFSGDFYLDRNMIVEALKRRASFNIIHLASSFKFDFFMLRLGRFDQESFSRRLLRNIDPARNFDAFVQSAEDTVLAKLEWYRMGGGVSEIQWRDVLGILKTQAETADLSYMQRWAQELGIADLLARTLREAGITEE
jgi:hypothetical protein